jgi:hypothetical protein
MGEGGRDACAQKGAAPHALMIGTGLRTLSGMKKVVLESMPVREKSGVKPQLFLAHKQQPAAYIARCRLRRACYTFASLPP